MKLRGASRGAAGLAGLAVAAMVALPVAGCGSSGGEKTAPPPAKTIEAAKGLDPNYKDKITVLSFFGLPTYKKIDDLVKQQITTKYPNVKISFQYTDPAGITQKIKTGVAGGDPADLAAYLPGPSFVELAQAGTLLDLTGLIKSDSVLQKISADWAKRVPADQYTFQGKTLGMVATLGPMSVWYWKSMLAKVGFDKPPATVDELIAAAKKLRAGGAQPMSMGLDTASLAQADYTYNQLMGNFDDGDQSKARLADKGKLAYSDPAFTKGLELFKRLKAEGVFNDSLLQDSYDPAAKNLWKDKKVAMFWPSGPWMAHYVSGSAAKDIGVMSLPSVDGKSIVATGTDLSMVALGVSSRQKSREHGQLVGEIIKAYLSPEAQKLYYEQGIFPADTSVVDGSSPGIWGRVLDAQVKNLDGADRIVDYSTYTPAIYTALTNGVGAMLAGDKNVEQVIKSLEKAQKKAHPCAPGCAD